MGDRMGFPLFDRDSQLCSYSRSGSYQFRFEMVKMLQLLLEAAQGTMALGSSARRTGEQ